MGPERARSLKAGSQAEGTLPSLGTESNGDRKKEVMEEEAEASRIEAESSGTGVSDIEDPGHGFTTKTF